MWSLANIAIYFCNINNSFKYIENVANGKGKILVHKRIGNSVDAKGNVTHGINGSDFANEMEYLQSVCKEITVDINSVGGSVLDAMSMCSSMLSSKVPVRTVVSGLAASSAGFVAACGHEGMRDIMDYAAVMAHNSTGPNKELCDFFNKQINTILSGRSGKKPEDVESMMTKETWMTAKEAKEHGFVDNIISSGKKVKTPQNATPEELANIYNEYINPKKSMSKINGALKISNNADESEQYEAISKMSNDLVVAQTENTALKAEVEVLKKDKTDREAAETLALKNDATELANSLEKAGKIKKEDVAITIQNASESREKYNFIAKMLGGAPSSKDAKHIFDPSKVKNAADTEKEAWTYSDYEKKGPEALSNMYVTDRPAYDELFKNDPKYKKK